MNNGWDSQSSFFNCGSSKEGIRCKESHISKDQILLKLWTKTTISFMEAGIIVKKKKVREVHLSKNGEGLYSAIIRYELFQLGDNFSVRQHHSVLCGHMTSPAVRND